jgi:hypothetical protein
MRTLLSLAAVLVALAGSRSPAALAAPQPKEAPAAGIEGKYTLLSVGTPPVVAAAPGGVVIGGPGGAAGGWGVATSRAASVLVGPATITKTEILLEGRTASSALAAALGANNTPTAMEYTLDASKTPMTIDVQTTSLRGKKTKTLGLAEVVGNRLIIAVAAEGGERPKTTDEAEGVTVYYFQKAPPAPKTEFRIVAMTVGKEADAEKELNKLAQDGYELVSTTTPAAPDARSAPTTVHFVLKRTK